LFIRRENEMETRKIYQLETFWRIGSLPYPRDEEGEDSPYQKMART